jgi:adenine-specific DNA-methyltransferase
VKIPNAVLARCEWGKDDYSLNVANLPMMKEPAEEEEKTDPQTASPPRNEKRKGKPKPQLALFAGQGK